MRPARRLLGEERSVTKRLAGDEGIALIEVLIAAIVLGVAVVGLALMLSLTQVFVVARGDEYVALYAAQQKIEKLMARGFANIQVGDKVTTNCGTAPPNDEPCYDEALPGAGGQLGEQVGASGTQTFRRQTTVAVVTGGECDPSPPAKCMSITVTVTPTMRQADPVTLAAVVTAQN